MERYRALINVLLSLAVVTVIFDNIPKFLQLSTLSSGYASHFSWYPLLAMAIVWIIGCFRGYWKLDKEGRIMMIFGAALTGCLLISNILGILTYPYYGELLSGPVNQIEKLPKLLNLASHMGIDLPEQTALMGWISIRAVKYSICMVLFTFGFSFVIYELFQNRWKQLFHLIQKAVLVSVGIICLYSVIELLYLAGNETATWMLKEINPCLHPIAADHGWWPPLLWKGQLRSVFCEPSRMGNYAAFALPFLWEWILARRKKYGAVIALTGFYTFLLFTTRARTAVGMYWGLLGLLFLLLLILRNKGLFKRFILIAAITVVSLVASVGFINFCMTSGDMDQTVASYLEDNVGSLASADKRSNGARYALIRSNIATGLDNPVFGVGNVLGAAYTVHHFNEADLNSQEVQMWVHNYQEQGVLRYGLDAMNEWVSRFAQNGLVGLVMYLVPFVFAVIKLFQMLWRKKSDEPLQVGTVLVSLVASAVAGCNGSLTMLYAYWIILALAYVCIFSGGGTAFMEKK